MSVTSPNASLVLSTNNGTTNASRTSTTWSNINLRSLLGDMYDKYDTFNLCLNTVATGVSQSYYNASPNDLQVLLRIQGLPFLNNTYNIGNTYNANNNICTIGTFTFNTTTLIPYSTFTGTIAVNTANLTVSAGTYLPIGSSFQFFDPNTSAFNTKTITSQNNTTTYAFGGAIGASGVNNVPMSIVPATSATQYFYGSNLATFGKNQDICNLTIDYLRLNDLSAPAVNGTLTFPHTTFIFDIFGIEKDKENLNGTRL
jgi:hypothetical protein